MKGNVTKWNQMKFVILFPFRKWNLEILFNLILLPFLYFLIFPFHFFALSFIFMIYIKFHLIPWFVISFLFSFLYFKILISFY